MAQLGLLGIGHVALKVSNIENSLAFYRDTLGFDEMMRLNRDDGSLWLVYLRITDTQFIELFPGGEGMLRRAGRSPPSTTSASNPPTSKRPRRAAGTRHPAHCRAQDGPR